MSHWSIIDDVAVVMCERLILRRLAYCIYAVVTHQFKCSYHCTSLARL